MCILQWREDMPANTLNFDKYMVFMLLLVQFYPTV